MSFVLLLLTVPALLVIGLHRLWPAPTRRERHTRGWALLGFCSLMLYTTSVLWGLVLWAREPGAWPLWKAAWLLLSLACFPWVYLRTDALMRAGMRPGTN